MYAQLSPVARGRFGCAVRRGLAVATIAMVLVGMPALSGAAAAQERPCSAIGDDYDGDGISCYDERYIYGTHPRVADTDYDGFSDWEELFELGTNPLDPADPGAPPPAPADRSGPALSTTARATARVKQPVTIQADASDPSGISRVELLLCSSGCKQVGEDVEAPYSFVRKHPKPGRKIYMVVAYDTAGNLTESVFTIQVKPAKKK